MSRSEAFRILDAAWELGIRAFDTAEGYGSSPARLREWSDARGNASDVEVVTKCRIESLASAQEIENAVTGALSSFDGVGSRVFLTHGSISANSWPPVLAAVARYDTVAGQSVYSPEEVSEACGLTGTGRVQAPGNVLDRRALRARGNSAVPLDIRSVYLQGVLLDGPDDAEARAPGASPIVSALRAKAVQLQTDLAPLLIASMLRLIANGDRLVVGVDDLSQLGAIAAAQDIPRDTVGEFIDDTEKISQDLATDRLLDPRSWPSQAAATRVSS